MAAPILSYESLGLVQGEGWLFRGLDIHVRDRDRLALIGRNGAGKTTLLKCLADAIDPDEGRRTIVPGTKVVLLEQDPAIAGETLRDWIVSGPDAPAQHEAAAIADQIGLDLDRSVATASGGERRRAAMGRAIGERLGLTGPVLFGDSAFGDIYVDRALSAVQRRRVRDEAVRAYRAHPQVAAVFTRDELAAAPSPSGSGRSRSPVRSTNAARA